jgi:hypothetical protein
MLRILLSMLPLGVLWRQRSRDCCQRLQQHQQQQLGLMQQLPMYQG